MERKRGMASLLPEGRWSALVDSATIELYQAGLTSHASVNVMLALEGEFDVEFPDRMLKRSVFESVSAIRGAIEELTGSMATRDPSAELAVRAGMPSARAVRAMMSELSATLWQQ